MPMCTPLHRFTNLGITCGVSLPSYSPPFFWQYSAYKICQRPSVAVPSLVQAPSQKRVAQRWQRVGGFLQSWSRCQIHFLSVWSNLWASHWLSSSWYLSWFKNNGFPRLGKKVVEDLKYKVNGLLASFSLQFSILLPKDVKVDWSPDAGTLAPDQLEGYLWHWPSYFTW